MQVFLEEDKTADMFVKMKKRLLLIGERQNFCELSTNNKQFRVKQSNIYWSEIWTSNLLVNKPVL